MKKTLHFSFGIIMGFIILFTIVIPLIGVDQLKVADAADLSALSMREQAELFTQSDVM